MTTAAATPKTERTTFVTSRLLDFANKTELQAQIGHDTSDWPLVVFKELIDNSLDACEEASIAPELTVKVNRSGITIRDNGPGLPQRTIEAVLNFDVRVSSREAYSAPDRGRQGNALKTVVSMPFALDGDRGRVTIASLGEVRRITFSIDPIHQEPVISVATRPGNVKNGTIIKVWWPENACSLLDDAESEFLQILDGYVAINPHASFALNWFGRIRTSDPARNPSWTKWTPSTPTPPHWYELDKFERLLAATIANDDSQGEDRPIREFIAEFAGFSGSRKQKTVLDAVGLTRCKLSALVNGNGFDHSKTSALLDIMKIHGKPAKPASLGVIGEDHIRQDLETRGCDMTWFRYKKAAIIADGMPCVIEAAFAANGPEDDGRTLITGVNWSPGLGNPFRKLSDGEWGDGLENLLGEQECSSRRPITILVHLARPGVQSTDRGKSAIVIGNELGQHIKKIVTKITDEWRKVKRSEDREAKRGNRQAKPKNDRLTIKEAAWKVIPSAYHAASSQGTLPAKTRQVYYQARGRILELTGKPSLDQRYFSQTVLPEYMAAHPDDTSKWDIVQDARGKLTEPHTRRVVPLGTLEVRSYLRKIQNACDLSTVGSLTFDPTIPTCGPLHRYGALVYNEKEGFDELFKAVHLSERHDVAILSNKGVSVTATRELAENLCSKYGIPLFVMRDFDKAGFTIAATLQRDTKRYQFTRDFTVIDLGLRLEDVEEWGLESEPVSYGVSSRGKPIDPRPNLRKNGATRSEITFLCSGQNDYTGEYFGRRVELNAFVSGDLVEWIEKKLAEHGVEKVVPSAGFLTKAYRRAIEIEKLNQELQRVQMDVSEWAKSMDVPDDLDQELRDRLEESPELSWDDVVGQLASDALDQQA